MIIQSSSVAMSSKHSYSSYSHATSLSLEARADKPVTEEILKKESDGIKSSVDAMKEYMKEQKEKQSKQQQENMVKSYQETLQQMKKSKATGSRLAPTGEEDAQIKMLRRMLAFLQGKKEKDIDLDEAKRSGVLDLSSQQEASFSFGVSAGVNVGISSAAISSSGERLQVGTTSGGTVWQKVTASEVYYTETERMAFATNGVATTADGRQFSFGVEIGMSRAFCATYSELTAQQYIRTDPLMINLDTNVASVSDMKFMFDINNDGKEEEISFAGKGSGFLAYDKNGDGRINDGGELFGTKSGDGFKDLAQYDEDGNGWIDEADDIFNKLKIWTKDAEGNDCLVNLKSANVGAIYLGNTDTEYALNDSNNKNLAMLRKTGIYLKENGGVGTVNHVDLTL